MTEKHVRPFKIKKHKSFSKLCLNSTLICHGWYCELCFLCLLGFRLPCVTHLVVLGVRLQQAVLLDGHRGRQRNSISPLLSFLLATALHARRGRLGQGTTAQSFITHTLERDIRRTTIVSW